MDEVSIQYVSDVHLEYRSERDLFWWEDVIIPRADTLVLAGDIAPAYHPALPVFYKWCNDKFDQVIHVPGNHEYWKYKSVKRTIDETDYHLSYLCDRLGIIYCQKNIIQFHPSHYVPKIVGCTLWTNLSTKHCYNIEFSMIRDFTPETERVIHNSHVNFIKNSIDILSVPPIVVTHHAPLSKGTLRKEFEGNPRTVFYVNDLDLLVDESQSWIFGHTHHVCDLYRENGIVVTSNPIGRPDENLNYSQSSILNIKFY